MVHSHWPTENAIASVVLSFKYSILYKIVIVNWLPRVHISSILKDLVVLLFAVGIGEEFDLSKVIFQVIKRNVKTENTTSVLPYLLWIFEVLQL